MNNQRQIAIALQMYAQDNGETMPASNVVWGALSLDKGILVCPSVGKRLPIGYLYNNNLSGRALGDITTPVDSVLTMDGKFAKSSATTYDNIWYVDPTGVIANGQELRHTNKAIATYVDGHAAVVGTLGASKLFSQVSGISNLGLAGYREGTIFSVLAGGQLLAYRYYKAASEAATSHTFRLFAVNGPVDGGYYDGGQTGVTGTLVANSKTVSTGEAAGGQWVTVPLATPITLTAGTYAVCVDGLSNSIWDNTYATPLPSATDAMKAITCIQDNTTVNTDTFGINATTGPRACWGWIFNIDVVYATGI